ncbi:MAG: TIGR00266 family protein [Oscillospiraceae bacterium]|nr:TIGR00266 family protein [Oscillospiraceae bacterium]
MNYIITSNSAFPMAEITLAQGENIKICRGGMVYHRGDVTLEGKLNTADGKGGVGGAIKAMARSTVSGESMWITHVTANTSDAKITIAPPVPGCIKELQIGGNVQWRLSDGVFLACDASVAWTMQRQSLGKAVFGTGGLFVMETQGQGTLLIDSFGDLIEIQLDGSKPLVADNAHVVAWTTSLQYKIGFASGIFGVKTGEGIVNTFNGVGSVLIQTKNLQSLAGALARYSSTNS